MKYNEIRNNFLDFFKNKNHTIVKSASLIPNDETVLFTVAGMVPWKKILIGEEKPFSKRVANVQKCLRAGGKHNDLEDVGLDGRHHTFFEMMGNWSFGDYFKEEAIVMAWELISKLFDTDKIHITTHTSDEESTKIWKKLTNKDPIRLGDKDNWWSEGDTGPCGPCTEIFYDLGDNIKEYDNRYVEIWNNVFMEYNRLANGNLIELPYKNVDTGAGLERWACVLQNKTDNFDTDLFINLTKATEDILGIKQNDKNKASFKIITDHIRAISFSLADGVIPSNTDRGYVIRRILRRAMRHIHLLGYKGEALSKLFPAVVREMNEAYPELNNNYENIINIIKKEENSFYSMLSNGIKTLEEYKKNINNNVFSGEIAFKLYDTYGFPLDLTESILKEENIKVETESFYKSMKEQKERSKTDSVGTKTLWESINVNNTDDSFKYNPESLKEATILKILKDGKLFTDKAYEGDNLEILLDKTCFYGTQGGQIGDTGFFVKNSKNIVKIEETFRVNNLVIHKGQALSDFSLNDIIEPKIDFTLREQIAKAHTATHLLHSALKIVLNKNVEQRGSKISHNSLRFDFTFERALLEEEKTKIENLINKWINDSLEVNTEIMELQKAKQINATALFNEKYSNIVRVVKIGKDTSIELCGGTHVNNTSLIKNVKIIKEKSISAGIRRITMSVNI